MEHLLLQQRLEEPSAVMGAAEGLSAEQRLLARDLEISATIKVLQAEQADIRNQLKEYHIETGERVSLGPVTYAPISKDNWTYDVPAFMKKFGKKASQFLEVSGTLVTAALKSRQITEADLEGMRTNTPSLTHHTKREDV